MSVFWPWFEAEAKPKLGIRDETFAAMFHYLDGFKRPVKIIETGCMRKLGNWAGDGCSTLMFDRYVKDKGGRFCSVDIDRRAVELCESLISTEVVNCDSVHWLREYASGSIDLLYLDSFDLDMVRPLRSQVHHINELLAALPLIRPDTLVAVDDSPCVRNSIGRTVVEGKGALVARYAEEAGATMIFGSYQVAWTGIT